MEARKLSSLADRRWRVLAGPNLSRECFKTLQHISHEGIVVERTRDDFPELLEGAALSISQAGYNTALDVISARVRAVLVPFETKSETEQSFRAERMAAAGLAEVVRESELTPERLAVAVDRALASPQPEERSIGVAGANESARIIYKMITA